MKSLKLLIAIAVVGVTIYAFSNTTTEVKKVEDMAVTTKKGKKNGATHRHGKKGSGRPING